MTQKLKVIVQQHEAELAKWRAGEEVPESARSKLKLKTMTVPSVAAVTVDDVEMQGSSGVAMPTIQLATPTNTPIATPTPVQKRAFEEERTRLCQQLDEKVDDVRERGVMW